MGALVLDSGAPRLRAEHLQTLSKAVARRVVELANPGLELGRYVPDELRLAALDLLRQLAERQCTPETGAVCLDMLAIAEQAHEAAKPRLVWSKFDNFSMLDTTEACEALFARAERSVLLSTYNIGTSESGNPVLEPLSRRLTERPKLRVQLFLGVPWKKGTSPADRLAALERELWTEIWPWPNRPEVYVGPWRPVDATMSMHAKCVTIDDTHALVTSANLSWSAHARNVEAGVLLADRELAYKLRVQFERLFSQGVVRRMG